MGLISSRAATVLGPRTDCGSETASPTDCGEEAMTLRPGTNASRGVVGAGRPGWSRGAAAAPSGHLPRSGRSPALNQVDSCSRTASRWRGPKIPISTPAATQPTMPQVDEEPRVLEPTGYSDEECTEKAWSGQRTHVADSVRPTHGNRSHTGRKCRRCVEVQVVWLGELV